jgi:SAM-dependent methyltransferase
MSARRISFRENSEHLALISRTQKSMDRKQLLLSLFDLSGVGLEIGPGFDPLVPKSSGRRIETVDHASAAELREKYRNAATVDISRIEEVDYVWDGRSLADIIKKEAHYDYIVASHVIEHTPDLLGFLQDCQAVLKQDGVLVLAVPDKRRCFDVFQSLTSTGMVLQAHLDRQTRHTPGQMFDFIAYNGLRDGMSGWSFEADGPLTFAHDLDFARYGFEQAISSNTYVDAHAWRFTPSSFRLVLNDLHACGHLALREAFFAESDTIEFYVSLSRCGPGCPFDRLTLARMTLVEQQEIAVGPIAAESLQEADPIGATSAAQVVAPHIAEAAAIRSTHIGLRCDRAPVDGMRAEPRIVVMHGGQRWEIEPAEFETFPFEAGDQLSVIPADSAATLPVTWGNIHVEIGKGHAILVPPRIEFFEFKGYKIPVHLINLTGAGAETLEQIGKAHIQSYRRYIGLESHMTIVELGCGIGRDAFQLLDLLGDTGRYVGIDVTRDSIIWCQNNITPRHPNFTFHHFDAHHELYNPYGARTSTDFQLPMQDEAVDRIVLASVFTHLLASEVLHYMKEFRRVLKPSGLVYASFFLYSQEAIVAAQLKGNTPWKATFARELGDGVYGNDPDYPRGAVAFTDGAMRRMIDASGLRLVRPYLKGWWSGLHADPEDGQDVAILARALPGAMTAATRAPTALSHTLRW